ncbi:MAG: diguanylate cyclase [Treponema sp.]|nr:diguanylate cyclase [Treponema sp.]
MSKKIRDFIFGFISFIVHLVILNLCYGYVQNLTVNEDKNRYKYIAINEANYISNCVDKVVVRTYTLREMLYENQGNTDFFEKAAPKIMDSIKEDTGIQVRNLLLAPQGIVSKVEPLINNEGLIGFDLSDESYDGNKEAVEANIRARTILTNPFSLVQGGIGMSARTPVYIQNGKQSEYWGLVSVTIDFDDLIKAFEFENLTKMHIDYCLWHYDLNGNKVILSSNNNDIQGAISEKVTFNNLFWYLDVAPSKGWKNENIDKLAHIVIFLISILFSGFILLVFRIRRDGNKMKVLAEQDNLTNCYSRYYLNSNMLDAVTGDWRYPENKYSVAIVDVDNFKHINDAFGHTTGDRALTCIADILKKSISNPAKDRIVRFGGDEFIIFFSNIERKTLRIKFQDILSAVEQIRFDDIPDLKLTISMGVAIPENVVDKSYSNMLKVADEKLYQVKENGRNNYLM